MKQFLTQQILPDKLFLFLKGYGWHGDFKTWQAAKEASTGYDSKNIINQLKESLLKVKNGEAIYERDSVLFDKIEYSWELLSALMWIAAQNKGDLHIIDFGGSLGSTYYQNKIFLDKLENVSWNIVEQPNYVGIGRESFQSDTLRFYTSINECCSKSKNKIKVILFSSVLQYLEFPYEILKEAFDSQIEYIIIDRTGFTLNNRERITIQKVPDWIYKATYPCRFFNEKDFLFFFEQNIYRLLFDFNALDHANIQSKYKGFVFKRRDNA
jgi:putative methyltransferase (TIGR04325 family)